MKDIIFDSKCAQIYYEHDNKLLVIIWKRVVLSDEYKQAFSIVLDAVKKYNAPLFLSDTRLQGAIGPDDRIWLETEMIPQALSAGLKYSATVLPKDAFKKYYLTKIKDQSKKSGMTGFELFEDFDEARMWLLSDDI